ncbi:MAG: type II toxin-antitoxin system RelE/ParE family toxin [Brevundimonas sp.]|uniref:type II toxin-antitoxin system RelE/ParE family toxin n=1 Tax=Brevundimonas sp. TaxID=1871086 RepID=UPI00271AA4F6|nr:type II toxin-antitoxin system RelE/ParE family toxin [Brevundimonas sp.]MDO9077125.1 type II toxin-antitoxin system RelE/ParE family toxin [Brevundimonas sp.]MDP3080856.1 type II toxin-antitoxin system RelE/ParE family toxin [Brevundimonas sp.]MDZ4060769.1 type II toxin-antitoxin system RelE/ParE family toxin [Brevundimonas sp.]
MADRDRLFEFLTENSHAAAERAMSVLVRALEDIAAFPAVGRAGPHGYRKLTVRLGQAGYEIRYRHYPDRVVITRIFHTREDR